MRVQYCGGKSGKIRPVTLARFFVSIWNVIATPLSHDKFKLDPCMLYAYAVAVPGEHKGTHIFNVSAAEP